MDDERKGINHADMLTVEQVAELLELGVRTVWRYEKAGKIPVSKQYGRKKKWDKKEFELWWKLGRPISADFEKLKKRG